LIEAASHAITHDAKKTSRFQKRFSALRQELKDKGSGSQAPSDILLKLIDDTMGKVPEYVVPINAEDIRTRNRGEDSPLEPKPELNLKEGTAPN
jgi:hypothetical protein